MRICDPVRNPGWDHLVALHRDAGCFHTSAWAKVLQQTYNHHPFYLRFSRGRRLTALVPLMEVRSPFTGRRGVCLPFSDACEPLIFEPNVRWGDSRSASSFRARPSVEALGNPRRQILSTCAQCSDEVLRARPSSMQRACPNLRRLCQFSAPCDSKGGTQRRERYGPAQSRGGWRFLPTACSNTPPSWPSATTSIIFPEHLQRDHQARAWFYRRRRTAVAASCRRDLLSVWKERSVEVWSVGRAVSGVSRE